MQLRRLLEGVVRRGRGHGPLEAVRPVPDPGRGALAPPRTQRMISHTNSSCDRPKPKAPIDETMFQSVNCVA